MFLSNADENYSCNFDAFDQKNISEDISAICEGPWLIEAQQYVIFFSDVEYFNKCKKQRNYDIHLLIGANVNGKLITGNHQLLSSGLAAIETRLGWTLMGKVPTDNKVINTALSSISLHIKSEKIKDLWELDILGIKDPIESKCNEDLHLEALDLFNRTAKGNQSIEGMWLLYHG